MTDETVQIMEQQNRAAAIKMRLEWAGAALRRCDTARRATMSQIGALLREAKRLDADRATLDDPRLGSRVEITEAAALTGLSRPTLYQLAADVPPDDGYDLATLSNEAVARMHAGYGYGGHEQVDAEFWARYPLLAGWHNAIGHLYDADDDWDPTDPGEWTNPPAPPGADVLRKAYRAAVDRIAAGPLAE